MNEKLTALNAKLDAQAGIIDGVTTSLTGIRTDVADLKEQIAKLQAAGGGATVEEIDQLAAKVDVVDGKLNTLSTDAASLDAETVQAPPPPPEETPTV